VEAIFEPERPGTDLLRGRNELAKRGFDEGPNFVESHCPSTGVQQMEVSLECDEKVRWV